MGWGSPLHWIVLLVIVLLVFGTKKIRNIGEDLGGAIKGFKKGLKDGEQAEPASPPPQPLDGKTIDVEVKEKAK